MNSVFGKFFSVDATEAFEPEAAALGSVPRGTFIFDDQLHHVSDTWSNPIVLVLRTTAAGFGPPFGLNQQMIPWNPALVGTQIDFASVSFNNFLKEVFLESVVIFPELTAHILGQLLKGLGSKRILWGTDSMWYGSPQWQIDAFWRFQIPEQLRKRFDYPELDSDAKLRILGLNSAKLYKIKNETFPDSKNPDDVLARMRDDYQVFQKEEGPARSNATYGWIRAKE